MYSRWIVASLSATAVVVVGGIFYLSQSQSYTPPVACTAEAMICPDGTAVGRTGPDCAFAACPAATSTATTTVTPTPTPGPTPKPSPSPVACTMEAKLCPDGSYVGRTGPNCEFTACPAGILPYNSGVRGTVLLGPTCPVERMPPDPQCADRPYATTVTVARTNTPATIFSRTQSAADGTFQLSLPPGNYVVNAAGGQMLPRCAQTPVTVNATGYTHIVVSCDTGIR